MSEIAAATLSAADVADADAHLDVPAPNPTPDPQTERTVRKTRKRVDALAWVPTESAAVLHENVTLGSKTVQRAFNLWYSRAQINLYMLQGIIPEAGTAEQARGVNDVVDARLDELEKELAQETERLRHLAKVDGIDHLPPKNFSQQMDLRVPKFTPASARFLRIVRGVDDLYWLLEVLWISGVIKSDTKWNIINRWKRLMMGMVKFTQQTWLRARTALRQSMAARRKAFDPRSSTRDHDTPASPESVDDTNDVDAIEPSLSGEDGLEAAA